jgi:hypothetical protein
LKAKPASWDAQRERQPERRKQMDRHLVITVNQQPGEQISMIFAFTLLTILFMMMTKIICHAPCAVLITPA